MEEELARLAKEGDKEAYKELIEKHKMYLFNIAIAILKNEDDSGDAISETIIKGYENIKGLREPKFFKTWITRILINESKKILKRKSKVILMEEWQEQNQTQQLNTNSEEVLDLKVALAKLSKEQYSVIMLFYYNDLKINEISAILDIPEGTVKSRLSNAKQRLYEILLSRKEDSNGE